MVNTLLFSFSILGFLNLKTNINCYEKAILLTHANAGLFTSVCVQATLHLSPSVSVEVV